MNFRQAFRLTWRKSFLALFLFLFLPVIKFTVNCFCVPGSFCPCPYITHFSVLAVFQIGLEGIGFDWFLFAGIIVAYLLSSIIFHSFSRISPEMKDRFKQSLSMTKGRYIVMILGWLTIFPVFMHFISGMVGGLVNFTPMMHFSYGAGEFLAIILLPLSMFTFYVLFPFNMMLVWIFYFVTKVQIGMGGFTIVPEDLTIAGIIMMIPLLLIEWFIVSHAIVSFFNRIRNRFQKKDRSIPP